jgi:hypothetical protein
MLSISQHTYSVIPNILLFSVCQLTGSKISVIQSTCFVIPSLILHVCYSISQPTCLLFHQSAYMLVLPSISLHVPLLHQSAYMLCCSISQPTWLLFQQSAYMLCYSISHSIWISQHARYSVSQPTYLLVHQSAYMPCYSIDSLHTSYSVSPHVLLFHQSAYMLCFFVRHPTYLLLSVSLHTCYSIGQPAYFFYHQSIHLLCYSVSLLLCSAIPSVSQHVFFSPQN